MHAVGVSANYRASLIIILNICMDVFNKKKLTRWSRLVRRRDHHCYLCEESESHRVMQAHHIKPKHLYPELAYDLNNGIQLCRRCHMEIIHTTNTSHKKMYVLFKRYIKRKKIKLFNETNQYIIDK